MTVTEAARSLHEQLQGWSVVSEAGTLTDIRTRTVVLIPVKIDRVDAVRLQIQTTYAAWVLIPKQDTARFEENLENALHEFVEALESTGLFTWNTANRGVLQDTYTGYRLELIPTFNTKLGE